VANRAALGDRPVVVVDTAHHRLADGQTTRDGGRTWQGVVFCSCGWAGGIVDYPTRSAAEAGLERSWRRHVLGGTHL
jgi:hypothetical protein